MDIEDLGEAIKSTIERIEASQTEMQSVATEAYDNVKQAQADTLDKLNNLKTQIKTLTDDDITKIKNDTHDLQRYAYIGAMGQSVINLGLSIADITTATISHRPPHEIAGHALKMTGSIAIGISLGSKLLGSTLPWLGPFAVFFGECFLAAGSAMTVAVPEKSVSDQIKEELAEFSGDERKYQLDGVLDAIERIYADLRGRADNSLLWDEVNRIGRFTGPDEVIWLGAAESWLHDKLQAEVWPKVFTAYAHVSGQFLQNLMEGFRKIKWPQPGPDGFVKPSDDVRSATLVLEAICGQYKDMLKELLPEAGLKAPRWFIGSNGNLYEADIGGDKQVGFHDTRAIAISIGSDGDRIWTVGENRRVYTYDKQSESWDDLGDYLTADDIMVVRKTGTGQDHVFVLNNGIMAYRCWEEARDGCPKFIPDAPCPFKSAVVPQKIKMLAATGHGVAFYQLEIKPLEIGVWDAMGSRAFQTPSDIGSDVIGMTAYEDRLYIYSRDKIYCVDVVKVVYAATDVPIQWTQVNLPPDSQLNSLFASPDGTLLAVLGNRMYLCCDDTGDKWHETDVNTAQKAVMWPVSGWEMFARLKSTVKGVADLRDLKLAEIKH